MEKDITSKKVLSFLQTIPKWKVSTYKLIWEKFGLHPRAIAQIMKNNKNPLIFPCYKVISHSWKISWYSGDWWIEEKIKKLNKDWVVFIDWKISKSYYYI